MDNGQCYAWNGTPRTGFSAVLQGATKDRARYAFRTVLARATARRNYRARMVRLGALGDPARASHAELRRVERTARAAGLAVVGYTHHWRERANAPLSDLLMASCNNVAEADEALTAGWRPAAVLDWHTPGATFLTPGGAVGLVCPAQRKDNITCNDCRMCDPSHPVWRAGKISLIGFLDHSIQARTESKRYAKRSCSLD